MDRRTLLPATGIAAVVLFLAGAGLPLLQQISGPVQAQLGMPLSRGTVIATSRFPAPIRDVGIIPSDSKNGTSFAGGAALSVQFPSVPGENNEPLVLPPLCPTSISNAALIVVEKRPPETGLCLTNVHIPVMDRQPDGTMIVLPAAKLVAPDSVPVLDEQPEGILVEPLVPAPPKHFSLLTRLLTLLAGQSPRAAQPVSGVLATTMPVDPPVVFPGSEATRPVAAGEEPSSGPQTCSEESWSICADERWLDNLSVFAGLDGARTPEDLGLSSTFGGRLHVNWGVAVLPELGLGAQVGTAVNHARTSSRLLRLAEGTRERTQSFTTLGLFQRTPQGFKWALVHDFLTENHYSGIDARQWRGQIGLDLTGCDEVGLWGTWRARSDQTTVLGQTIFLRPIHQINFYWRRVWANDNVTRVWLGLAEEHGRFILTAPGTPPIRHPFCFGGEVHLPLTDQLALYGEAQFITPNDTGTVTAYFGLAWYPGGGARSAGCNNFAPMMPLANNTTLALDVQQ